MSSEVNRYGDLYLAMKYLLRHSRSPFRFESCNEGIMVNF